MRPKFRSSACSLRRLLAHSLAEVLWEQLLVDVSGSGGVFTLGDTSRLIGTTLSTVVRKTLHTTDSLAKVNYYFGVGRVYRLMFDAR